MNISYNWLKDYLSFDLTPQQLADALTSIGLETGSVEEKETIRGGLKGLVTGYVLTCEEHPNSDHLHVTTVDLGNGEPQQIVCGAPNVAAGQKVIVATIGTTLYAGDESFTIKKSKIRGVESNGMICAEDEIGVGTSHAGIIVLPADTPVGIPAAQYYKVESDYVLEVDITPNRIDAASHFGVARDLAAYLVRHSRESGNPPTTEGIAGQARNDVKLPSVETFKIDAPTASAITVTVENTEACPRYSGVTIKNIQVKESPGWMKKRLEAIGLRAINNVVDVTNYILHETGQPLHAFDAAHIKGGKVIVKTLPEGTSFVTLDGVERKLSSRDLMICNAESGMCIGGVFGGLDSGVTEQTTDVFLESAYFNPAWIRKTARRHGLNTDASFRFERGADPNNTLYVLKRAALLIKEVAGGTITGEIQDLYPVKIENPAVELSIQKVSNLIGKTIPEATIESILTSLEIEILNKNGGIWTLSIPTYRVDVTRDVDVIEDILRIYGYNNVEINAEVKSTLSYQTPTDRSFELQNLISEQLTGAGFNEILNNSLTSGNDYENLTSFPKANCVLLKNPLSSDLDVMRQTLLFGGLESIAYNRNRKNPDLRLYEFGNTYAYLPERLKENEPLSSIREEFKLALWLTGQSVTNSWIRPAEKSSIYELKACVENILIRLGVSAKKLVYKSLPCHYGLDPQSPLPSGDIFSAALSIETVSGKIIGVLGIIQKSLCKNFDVNAEVYFAELSWPALLKENKQLKIKQNEISKFPSVRRDLALLLDKTVSFAEIEKIACQTDRKILKEVYLFDVYEGKNLPEGKKSYAVAFILQDEEKTLNDKQIDAIMAKIQKTLEEKLGAVLR
ncbi:MAG: phenylalanine--tRNA ligase subunit beta [Dysgonamonadaceae bacterium]|jgi:phenylalanyl-tRNA synthetase beta chain|nr:phenylalanine--tRNA ligase subunit beta [Dysgonamonadaceae bacterium]